ncbi:hypothetical protein LTS10_009874 [Elasticomyces elasticus]|nr:hypothetical protein LTS10_009874 [Elasticomyces elasticus]
MSRILFNPDPASKQALAHARASGRIKQEEAVLLVEEFLRNVHTKNPVLEPTKIMELARAAAEDGFEWDVSSCLVLISCALGSLSIPFKVSHPSEAEASFADAELYSVAEAYYTAARKRLGLLERSLQATQCWFLTGMYEMYSMRPVSAWTSFNRACTLIQLRLQAPSYGTRLEDLEKRLYWSCLKSESEIREEFDLPSSGLGNVEWPDIFPSPPISSPNFGSGSIADSSEWETVHQSSWYYYLSEVAYRRIMHRTITTLYGTSPEQWLSMGVQRLHRIAAELDAQIVQWWQHIPGSPLPTFQQEADELTFMMLLNYFDLRERIWRPFVYVAVHSVSSPEDQEIIAMCATLCLNLSFEMIEGSTVKHRHHGCWLTARCLVTKALLIIAAAQSARVEIRPDWRRHVHGLQTYLQYWQVEAPDLGSASCAITRLLANMHGSQPGS